MIHNSEIKQTNKKDLRTKNIDLTTANKLYIRVLIRQQPINKYISTNYNLKYMFTCFLWLISQWILICNLKYNLISCCFGFLCLWFEHLVFEWKQSAIRFFNVFLFQEIKIWKNIFVICFIMLALLDRLWICFTCEVLYYTNNIYFPFLYVAKLLTSI